MFLIEKVILKDVQEQKNREILLGNFMDESETTEDEHTVLKTVTSDRQAKKKNSCKRTPFKRKPKTDNNLDSVKKIVVNIKK